MLKLYIPLLFLLLLFGCKPSLFDVTKQNHFIKSQDDLLKVRYEGVGDFIQFKMFQGVSLTLTETKENIFQGDIELPNLENGVFKYEIIVYEKQILAE
ncbi:MAG: hypothetical protein HC892_21090 [Saprospiraceae bacterium]|nr:hypothetical protein [Saprospiraceae bacterium]